MTPTHLFVYGTLRPGQRAWFRLAPYAVHHRPAKLAARMWHLPGDYPVIVLDESAAHPVVGEVITLRDAAQALAVLDDYEGSEYRRVAATVAVHDNVMCPALTYVAANEHVYAAGISIPDGDWVRYAASR